MLKLRDYYHEISQLITKELSGEINAEELDKLCIWRAANKRHEDCYRHIRERLGKKKAKIYYNINVDSDWKKVKQQIVGQNRLRKMVWKWGRYAATLLLVIGSSVIWNHLKNSTEIPAFVVSDQMEPIKGEIVLTLGNGEEVKLHSQKQDSIQSEGILIENLSGRLVYGKVVSPDIKEIYNTVTVPQGGEYQIVLVDGTKVWMNAKTTLTYPVAFVGNERKVKLSGEAYFEVSKNLEKPFIITTDDIKIKVLGTSFNVNAYQDEENVVTTLLEGKVQILDQEHSLNVLQPSEQAVWSRKTKELQTHKVNAYNYIQWLKGDFSFWDDDLETIMRILSRWYNMEYEFVDEKLKTEKFYGVINRYSDVYELLNQFEKTGKVHFQYQGNKIQIKK